MKINFSIMSLFLIPTLSAAEPEKATPANISPNIQATQTLKSLPNFYIKRTSQEEGKKPDSLPLIELIQSQDSQSDSLGSSHRDFFDASFPT